MDNIELRQTALAGSIILLVLLGITFIAARPKVKGRNPPGPQGLPILGNALQVPNEVSSSRHVAACLGAHRDCLAPWNVLPLATRDLRRARITKPSRHRARFSCPAGPQDHGSHYYFQPVILIGDIRLAKEILEKRAVKFSARPKTYYIVRHSYL